MRLAYLANKCNDAELSTLDYFIREAGARLGLARVGVTVRVTVRVRVRVRDGVHFIRESGARLRVES